MDEVKAAQHFAAKEDERIKAAEKAERRKEKRAAKKARIKAQARTKHWMEVSRTVCSLGALTMSALSLLHVYNYI